MDQTSLNMYKTNRSGSAALKRKDVPSMTIHMVAGAAFAGCTNAATH